MKLKEIIIEKLDNLNIKDELNEGWFEISPFLAFSSFKRNIFNKFNKEKLFGIIKAPVTAAKTAALVKKEQIKHDVGLKSGISGGDKDATVYRLTPEQIKVMEEIYKKYGNKIINEINQFRKNILAPYQVLKRQIKKTKSISFEEVYGLTYDEYKSALESGRKKILKRGDYFQKSEDKFKLIDKYEEDLEELNKAKEAISKGGKIDLSNTFLQKVYEKYDISDEEMFGFTPQELKKITDIIASNFSKLKAFINHPKTKTPPEEIVDLIADNLALQKGDIKNERVAELLSSMNKTNIKSGELSLALAKYMLRDEIRNKIKEVDSNIYKEYYSELIDEMIKKTQEKKKDVVGSAVSGKQQVELDKNEKKVWGKLPLTGAGDYSGKLENYYQKITDEDFEKLKQKQHIEKAPEAVEAKKSFDAEVKKFERKLVKLIGEEDTAKLKKFRLINNLITVKELKDVDSLFKTPAELSKEGEQEEVSDEPTSSEEEPEDDEEKKSDFISDDDFIRRIREYATMEFDTMQELNQAKKEVDNLVIQMRKQGDHDLIEKYRNVLMQIRRRRTTEQTEIKGQPFVSGDIITIGDIQKFAKSIINRKYFNVDQAKQDHQLLDKMVDQYKEEEPEAERNIKEIQFLLDQVYSKLIGRIQKSQYEE